MTPKLIDRFPLKSAGCKCKHSALAHLHTVRNCTQCDCSYYQATCPIVIPNFGRNQLGLLFNELGFTQGVEVGVHKGEFTEILCQANPKMHLYAVDAWQAYEDNPQRRLDKHYAEAVKRLEPYNCTLVRDYSEKAAKAFPDNSLDFAYIDAAHDFANVIADISAWTRVVRPGGIIAGHDYRQGGMGPTVFGRANKTFHVKEAVDGWTLGLRIDPWFVLGRKEEREGEVRDKIRSYLWFKE